MKKILFTSLPVFAALLVLALLALSIHSYRNSFAPGAYADPAEPRLQSPVTIRIPETRLPQQSEGADNTFLLEVVKERAAPFSTHYWPDGETILSIPVSSSKQGIRLRLSLWDAGSYLVSLRDPLGTKTILSFPIVVRTPLRLYRNDLILAVLIGILAWASGRIARGFAPVETRLFSVKTIPGRILFPLLLTSGMLLTGFSLSLPGGNLRHLTAGETSSAVSDATQETEGRSGIHPVRLFPEAPRSRQGGGLLVIRHRLDSWSDYGRIATLFEGIVPDKFHSQAFLLLPDDGRYRLTLWSPGKKQDMTGTLVRSDWIVRAFPSSPPFPKALFAGMTLFSIAFFLKGISYNPRRTDSRPKTWGEVS